MWIRMLHIFVYFFWQCSARHKITVIEKSVSIVALQSLPMPRKLLLQNPTIRSNPRWNWLYEGWTLLHPKTRYAKLFYNNLLVDSFELFRCCSSQGSTSDKGQGYGALQIVWLCRILYHWGNIIFCKYLFCTGRHQGPPNRKLLRPPYWQCHHQCCLRQTTTLGRTTIWSRITRLGCLEFALFHR